MREPMTGFVVNFVHTFGTGLASIVSEVSDDWLQMSTYIETPSPASFPEAIVQYTRARRMRAAVLSACPQPPTKPWLG